MPCGKNPDHKRKSQNKNIKLNKNTEYILISLKRFIYESGISRKNTRQIVPNKILTIDGQQFIINGCVYHSGTLESGHYVFINYDNKGIPIEVYDDSSHYPYKPGSNHENMGYIYLYKKFTEIQNPPVVIKPTETPRQTVIIQSHEEEPNEEEPNEEKPNEEEEPNEEKPNEEEEPNEEEPNEEEPNEEEDKTAIELLKEQDGNKVIECLAYYLADNFIEDYIKTTIFPRIEQQDPYIAVNKQANSYRFSKLEMITKITQKLEEYLMTKKLQISEINPFSYVKTIFEKMNEKKNENSNI
jgi:hypothetical protein